MHLQKQDLESCYCDQWKNEKSRNFLLQTLAHNFTSLFMVLQELIASRRDEQEARIAAVTEIQRVWRGYFTR